MRSPVIATSLLLTILTAGAGAASGEATPGAAGTTTLFWASTDAVGEFALEVTIDFGQENSCDLAAGTARAADDEFASHSLFLVEGPEGISWGFGTSSGGFAQVHAPGIVDTRDGDQGDSRSASGTGFGGSFSGWHRLTVAGMNLAAWENDLIGDASVALDVSCEEPFEVLDARGGLDLRLDSTWTMSGGTGASAFLVGSVNVGDQARLTTHAQEARVVASGYGVQAGMLTVDHPNGTEEWHLGSPLVDFYSLDGAAGAYHLTLDRVGAALNGFWAMTVGYSPGFDLAPGLQTKPGVTF